MKKEFVTSGIQKLSVVLPHESVWEVLLYHLDVSKKEERKRKH